MMSDENKVNAVEEQKCPSCGGALIFDPVSGRMKCEYCGTAYDIAQGSAAGEKSGDTADKKESISGFDFASLTDQVTDPNAADLPIYNCRSCGAELIAPPEQFALACPYCGNNIVLTQKTSGQLRPDSLIPFKIDPKSLPCAVKNYYKGKALLPKRMFSESSMGSVTGVYVPFWIFNGRVSGSISFVGETRSTVREGDYKVTTIKSFAIDRDVSMDFENVPVDASGRISDKMMDSLEPFDLADAVPFDMRYLAGFTADRFDVQKGEIEDRAKKRMFTTADDSVRAKACEGYSNVTRSGGKLNLDLNAKYMLLPVYLFDVAFDGKKYEFAVNGQTGRVVGDIPIDKRTSSIYFLIRAIGVAAVIIIVFVIKYFMGR